MNLEHRWCLQTVALGCPEGSQWNIREEAVPRVTNQHFELYRESYRNPIHILKHWIMSFRCPTPSEGAPLWSVPTAGPRWSLRAVPHRVQYSSLKVIKAWMIMARSESGRKCHNLLNSQSWWKALLATPAT